MITSIQPSQLKKNKNSLMRYSKICNRQLIQPETDRIKITGHDLVFNKVAPDTTYSWPENHGIDNLENLFVLVVGKNYVVAEISVE